MLLLMLWRQVAEKLKGEGMTPCGTGVLSTERGRGDVSTTQYGQDMAESGDFYYKYMILNHIKYD